MNRNEIYTKPKKLTAEQIARRRRVGGGALILVALTSAAALSPSLRRSFADLPHYIPRALSGESIPAKGQGVNINIGDSVKFTRASDGKVIVDKIKYASDIAADASAANPDVIFNNADGMLESEAAQARHGEATVYRVPKDWGLEDIPPSANG